MQHPCPRGVCPQSHPGLAGTLPPPCLFGDEGPASWEMHPSSPKSGCIHHTITSSPGCPCGLNDNMLSFAPRNPRDPHTHCTYSSQGASRCQARRTPSLVPAHRAHCPGAPRPGACPIPLRSYWAEGQGWGAGGVAPTKPHHVGFKPSFRGPLRPGPVSLPVVSACKALNQPAGTSLGHSLRSGNMPKALPPLMPTPGQVQRQEPQ